MIKLCSSADRVLRPTSGMGDQSRRMKSPATNNSCPPHPLRRTTAASFAILLALSLILRSPLEAGEPRQLSNESVATMVQAGLGADLVIAKIRQAPAVSFQLEIEDLMALKQQKVPETVIQAMLERATAPPPSAAPPPALGGPAGSANAFDSQLEFQREDLGIDVIRVALAKGENLERIRILRGELSTVAMGMAAFMDYPGLKARVRTTERRPVLMIKSTTPLTGSRYFLARLDVDDDDGVRSLKVSSYKGRLKAAFGNSRSFMEPDHDWVFEWSAEDTGNDVWKVIPAVDLEPGEYGWYADFGAGAQQSGIFDFGVD